MTSYVPETKRGTTKTVSLALGPRSYPSSQGSASTFSLASSSSSLLHYLGTSLDNLSPRSHQFGLVPLTFRVEELPPMAGYEGSLLNKPCEWFLDIKQDHYITTTAEI